MSDRATARGADLEIRPNACGSSTRSAEASTSISASLSSPSAWAVAWKGETRAASSVILREAGGTRTDITGGPWLFSEGGQLASNGVIHGAMLRAIKPALEIYATRQSGGV